jgi:hypothetical protein
VFSLCSKIYSEHIWMNNVVFAQEMRDKRVQFDEFQSIIFISFSLINAFEIPFFEALQGIFGSKSSFNLPARVLKLLLLIY